MSTSSLLSIYTLLRQHFGTLHGEHAAVAWWPIFGDDSAFEMLLGAVLVQQTRWEVVEGAILRLRRAGLLHPAALTQIQPQALASLLRPVAFHSQKAPGIIAIATHLCNHYGGSLAALLNRPSTVVRRELLALPRIGPETADVIMLYAGQHPVFVVDDYTRRLFKRVDPLLHAVPDPKMAYAQSTQTQQQFDWHRARYQAVQDQIEGDLEHALDALPHAEAGTTNNRTTFYADYHALINEQCVRYCLVHPRCDGPPARRVYTRQPGRDSYLDSAAGCPLRSVCAFYRSNNNAE